jgi:hypothetical protein
MSGKTHFRKELRKKLATAAKAGKKIGATAVVGAVVLGSISYSKAAGIEDVFDEHYYADMYPDLKEAYGYDRAALLAHFMAHGISEGRAMSELIDIVKYKETYGDLAAVFGDDWDAYVNHYLTHGAFEHRDSGTDFDPVDYLNRYGELKDAFGGDILAAYRHYEDHGKAEGREARSEAVVQAEEAQRRAEAEAEANRVEEQEPEQPSQPPTQPEQPSQPPTQPERPSQPPTQPEQQAFAIQKVEVVGTGHIRVTLNRATEQPLALEAFSIICNSGGSDMTILSVSTDDNRVYNLSTTYYKDQEYDIQITLADGTAISKVFTYRTDCAQLTEVNAVRTGGSEAVISYISDAPGYFYYILRANGQSQARAASLVEVVETVDAAEPTDAEVIKDGIRTEMNQHQNSFTVTGLTEGVSYTMYYVAVDTEEKATVVNSLTIGSEVHAETADAIKGAKPFAEEQWDGNFWYGFEIELETATSSPLTLDQFDISCPLSETTLDKVQTSDNKVYRVYMDRYSIPKGNNTYTIIINMADGTQLKGKCYFDLQAPNATAWDIVWTAQDTVEITVDSDEAGTLYYLIQDEVEGSDSIAPKDPTQVYANGTQTSMGHGSNYITVQGVKAGQWFCYATEDKAGNRESFYSYTQIPEYTPPTPEDESTPKITDFRISSNKELEVVFNQTINGSYTNEFTQISGMDGKILFGASYSSEGGLEDNVLNLTIMNSTISPGSHTLTLYFEKEDGSYSIVTYDFTV